MGEVMTQLQQKTLPQKSPAAPIPAPADRPDKAQG